MGLTFCVCSQIAVTVLGAVPGHLGLPNDPGWSEQLHIFRVLCRELLAANFLPPEYENSYGRGTGYKMDTMIEQTIT